MTADETHGYETILFEVADHVATITLNRPEVLNAFNNTMIEEFAHVWARCRTDDDIHSIVLRAAGGRAFSTGVDRKIDRYRHPNPWSEDSPGWSLGAKQSRVWKPLVCAVNGMCAGGAFYWVNEADVIIASDDATFFDPHASYGMVSSLEMIGLMRRIPMGEALRIALFGLDERMSARRALEIGLVSEVVPADDLWDRARVLALRLAAKPPLSLQGSVKAIWDSTGMSPQAACDIPLVYPQLINPRTKIEFGNGPRPSFETR